MSRYQQIVVQWNEGSVRLTTADVRRVTRQPLQVDVYGKVIAGPSATLDRQVVLTLSLEEAEQLMHRLAARLAEARELAERAAEAQG